MKHVNGDMDDLFRRAAEKYPLRTDGADWHQLAASLEKEPDLPSDLEAVERRRRPAVFWWFLLLPLAGIGYFVWPGGITRRSQPAVSTTILKPSASASAQPPASTQSSASAPTQSPGNASTQSSTSAGPSGTAAVRPTGTTADAGQGASPGSTARNPAFSPAGKPTPLIGSAPAYRVGNNKQSSLPAGGNKSTTTRGITPADGASIADGSSSVDRSTSPYKSTSAYGSASAGAYPGRPLLPAALDWRLVPMTGSYHLSVTVAAPATPVNDQKTPGKTAASAKTTHGYIGILGAPDLSTVRFQGMKGIGATFGLLLGYAFNDRWAVETGVYVDRKRYYTSGEYFDTTHVYVPNNTKLLSVDGTCYMWEYPLNLRYTFSRGARINWFATTGISTYLMTRENYTYQYQANNGSTWPGSWNLKKPSQYWFSIINLSAGFEQRLGKVGNLRMEPYLRIPLSGIGTGNLKIVSAGLNIGITRQLW